MTYKELLAQYELMVNAARAKEKELRATMQQLSIEAGLDPNLLGIHPHNAMLDYQAGKSNKVSLTPSRDGNRTLFGLFLCLLTTRLYRGTM